jgi:hypothetical protein
MRSRTMRSLKHRGKTVLGGLLLAMAIAIVPAASASAATFPNACKNSVTANQSQIGVTMTADAPASVGPGDSFQLTNIQQSANVPGSIFVAGYNLGLLVVGPNTVPAVLTTRIEGTNTVEGVQTTNAAATSISTTITDPDGSPGTGDESATDGTMGVTYADQTWTAGGSPGTIDFREDTVPIGAGAGVLHTGGLKITATIGGFLVVRFGCSPGTVTGPDPGVVVLDDPAVSFASTAIVVPVNQAPTADAGPDQTVASGASVSLTGSGSSDPDGDALDYSWTQTSGPAVTLTGANTATPSFTAPVGPATLTFELSACDPEPLCTTDSVTVNVDAVPNVVPTADAGPDQTVASNAGVSLNGNGSSDPDGTIASYAWTQTGGTAVTLSGANTATPSFTAPTGPATLTFQLEVTDNDGGTDTDSVTISVNAPPAVVDASGSVIVNGPTSSTKTSKTFVVVVTNTGTSPLTVSPADVDGEVLVNGSPLGSIAPKTSSSKTLSPGAKTRFRFQWSYTGLTAGATVEYDACVGVAGDINAGNDCGSVTVTAK